MMVIPIFTEVITEQSSQATCHPIGNMHTIRNMCNRHIFYIFLLPEEVPHLACDASMQFRDRVAPRCMPQRKDAHAEHLTLRHLMTCNIEELIARQIKLRPDGRKIFFNKP